MTQRNFIVLALILAACTGLWISSGNVTTTKPPSDPSAQSDPSDPSAQSDRSDPSDGLAPVPAPTSSPWNTYHGDAALQGHTDALFPDSLTLRWRFLAGAPVYNPPVSDRSRIFFASSKGEVFALDPAGKQLWTHPLLYTNNEGKELPDRVDAPAASSDGKVFVGTSRGILYALDATTGNELWHADIGAPILGTPNYLPGSGGPGRVYVLGQSDAALRCYDAATGALQFTSKPVDRCDASPSLSPEIAAFGSCAAAVQLVSPKTGDLLHNLPIDEDSQVAGGAAIEGNLVYVGCRSGKVLAADVAAGAFKWTSTLCDLEVFATPAISGAWLVTAAYDGNIYALDKATGAKRWHFETGGEPASPIIAGEKVFAAADGTLYMLHLDDGAKIWSEKAGDAISSPAIALGMVLLGVEEGAIVAYGPLTTAISPAPPNAP